MTRPPRITSRTRQPTTRGTGGYVPGRWGVPSSRRAPRPPKPPGAVPVQSAAVPATAVTPAAYSLTNLPIDASYDQQVAQLQRQRAQQLAGIAGERVRTLGDYGFTEGPNGALAFDPNNPLSKAAVLKKTHDTNRRSTAQSLGAGGQLYSGAFQNAQDLINRNQVQSEDAQQKALLAFLARNTGQTTEANTGYELAVGQADADRIARFQSNPNYDPATGQLTDPNAPAGDAPPPPAAANPRAAGETKVARGFVWQRNSNGTWRKIRPVNAFGR